MTDRIDHGASRVLASPNKFRLAVLGFNCSGGCSITTAPGAAEAEWTESVRIAQAADTANIEAIIPLGRWLGFGGDMNFNGRSFETFAWAAGIAALTQRAQVFSTFHVPTAHPVRVAKTIATIDHISNGRFGINIVAGWNEEEISMFGLTQREHDERYDYADEFMDVLVRLCNEKESFDYAGKYFNVPGAFSEPKPVQSPRPVVMGAAISPKGHEFAAKHADINFIAFDELSTAKQLVDNVKSLAREKYGREIIVFGMGAVICAETEKQAQKDYHYYVDETGDWDTAYSMVDAMVKNEYTGQFERESLVRKMIGGWGAQPLVGSPEQVVDGMRQMSEAGMDGMTISWVNYEEGIEQFRTELMPLMIEAGLRVDEPPLEAPQLKPVAASETTRG